ncbi:MAG: DUF6176 family protein [Peptococcaceae bacterium]|nr:DUF6176 family protein [Peptococcaceae bacterium]
MDIVLWKAKVKAGKEALAREWLDFLKANKEAGEDTLKQEKEHLEIFFTNLENGTMYLYMFVLADDLEYAAKVATSSGNPLDEKHFEYMAACVDREACAQMEPELALGDFTVFRQK